MDKNMLELRRGKHMGRSYLYNGQDTEHLNPAQRQLEALYDQIDRPGYRITAQQFFQTPQAMQLLDQLYGSLSDRVPPGSQIVSDTPGKLTYRDPDGYEHNIIRKPDGQFTETTSRPAILPNTQQQDFQTSIQQQLSDALKQFSQPAVLAQLDPQTAAQLKAISDAEVAKNAQTATDTQNQLLTRLYGNNVQQSSVAQDAAARLAQYNALVNQQQQSDAANRELQARQYITGLGQQNAQNQLGALANLYGNLSGQQTQTNIANAGLNLSQQQLQEQANEFAKNYNLNQLNTQTQQEQLDAANSPFNTFLKTLSAAGGLASGIGTGLSAYGALTRPKS